MTTGAKVTLGSGLFILLLTGVITARFALRSREFIPTDTPQLLTALHTFKPAGWEVREIPLGETEVARDAVARILRFDQAFVLNYRKAGLDFSLYLAYWRPGAANMRTVGAHTPDTCWVLSGWNTIERQSDFTGFQGGMQAVPGEYRCFSQQGEIQHVAFWYLIGRQVVPIWRNGLPTPRHLWKMLTIQPELLDGEQLFVRLSSPRPIEEIWNDPALQQLLAILGPAGLIPHSPPQ